MYSVTLSQSISVDSVEIVSEDISGSISVTVPTVEAPARHAATKDWILFSDLHVKASSIDTCEEVRFNC